MGLGLGVRVGGSGAGGDGRGGASVGALLAGRTIYAVGDAGFVGPVGGFGVLG